MIGVPSGFITVALSYVTDSLWLSESPSVKCSPRVRQDITMQALQRNKPPPVGLSTEPKRNAWAVEVHVKRRVRSVLPVWADLTRANLGIARPVPAPCMVPVMARMSGTGVARRVSLRVASAAQPKARKVLLPDRARGSAGTASFRSVKCRPQARHWLQYLHRGTRLLYTEIVRCPRCKRFGTHGNVRNPIEDPRRCAGDGHRQAA